jgi:hypothetical protein
VRRSPQEIAEELDRAQEIITDVAGRPAVGFRAPGYTLTTELLELLAERDYAYDSSLFPCPPYYLAKASVMGLLKLRGRPSASILDRPSVMWQRRNPHRRSGILEIPITVLPGLRFPLIGTSLVMMGAGGYRLIRPWMRTLSFVNLEFHGIDLCGLEEDGLDPALLRQPDMRVPLEKKRALFRSVLEDLTSGWRVDTLENLAGSLGEEP